MDPGLHGNRDDGVWERSRASMPPCHKPLRGRAGFRWLSETASPRTETKKAQLQDPVLPSLSFLCRTNQVLRGDLMSPDGFP